MKYLEILDVTVVVFTTNHHYPLFYLDDTLQAIVRESVVCLPFTQCYKYFQSVSVAKQPEITPVLQGFLAPALCLGLNCDVMRNTAGTTRVQHHQKR